MKIKSDFITNSSSSSFVAWALETSLLTIADEVYLKAFEDKLKMVEELKVGSAYWSRRFNELSAIQSDDEKIAQMKEDYDVESVIPEGTRYFSTGGQDEQKIGISPDSMERYFPEEKFGTVRQFVADKINEVFGTHFTEEDISFYEEAWMDN